MWQMTIEADTGEILVPIKMDGEKKTRKTYGNAILAFSMVLRLYCENAESDPEIIQWFHTLEHNTSLELYKEAILFLDSLMSGDMNYSEDEFEIYKQRVQFEITKDSFLKALEYAKNAWQDATSLAQITLSIADGLRKMPPIEKYWFMPQDTADGMEAISETIHILMDRNAKCVRINIQ